MSQVRLFCPYLSHGSLTLSPEESHHAITSRRVKAGAEVLLFDGVGGEASAVVTTVDRRAVMVDVSDIDHHPYDADLRLTLAVAMGKAHRQGYLIEKCTELGVAAFCPVVTERSVTKPGSSAVDRWSRRAIEAAKQSQRCWVPTIHPPTSLSEVIADTSRFAWVGFADTAGGCVPLDRLLQPMASGADILVLVGPEGGFSDAERDAMRAVGAVATSVAKTVLRTETAAVAVCAAIAMRGARSGAT